MFLCMMDRREALLLVDRLKRRTRDPEVLTAVRVCPRDGCPRDNPGIPAAGCPVDTAGCDAIHLLPGVRGTSGCRDGEEKKMAPWAPRLMLMAGSLGRPRGNPAQVWLLNGTASALAAARVTADRSCGSCATAGVPKLPLDCATAT